MAARLPLRPLFCAATLLVQVAFSAGAAKVPVLEEGLVSVERVSSGVLWTETFDDETFDPEIWEIWSQDRPRVQMKVHNGQLRIRGRQNLGHNGLRSRPRPFRDATLVGRVDVRSEGPTPHVATLHLCGHAPPWGPDHWLEVTVRQDEDDLFVSGAWASPHPSRPGRLSSYRVPRTPDGLLARVEIDAGLSLASSDVLVDGRWLPVVEDLPLPVRNVRAEVKIRSERQSTDSVPTVTVARFDDVRLYPRPASHPITLRIVRRGGGRFWFTDGVRSWPPRFRTPEGDRVLTELDVQLVTADGETVAASSRSSAQGVYMLELDEAPWEIYPVGARIRLMLDGEVFGKEIPLPLDGLDGLYPDDVYQLVVR